MPVAETLITLVAPALAKTILKVWYEDDKTISVGGGALVDILTKAGLDLRTRNKAQRELQEIGERAAESLQFIFDTEGKTLMVDEQELVAKLVAATLEESKITSELLAQKDLDPVKLTQHFLSEADGRLSKLSEPRANLFRRVIEEASQSIIGIAHDLPAFTERTFAEVLRREGVLIGAASEILDRLERMRTKAETDQEAQSAKFETEYRRTVARKLNRVELFGVDLSRASKSHPLNVAYVSLEVSGAADDAADSEGEEDESVIQSIEATLAENKRLLVRGPAGSGKTTLVRWIAVQAASRSFENTLEAWNEALPFVIRLRQFSNTKPPPPEDFPGAVADAIAGEMPAGWAHAKLRSGDAVVMIDGVDEVADNRREEVRKWVGDLVATFPDARIIVTSRPHAVEEGWLDAEEFGEADLQSMGIPAIEQFIDHWHRAVAQEVARAEQVPELESLAKKLKGTVRGTRSIRRLATSPLLCAVICALHRDSNERLPKDRIELYRQCCRLLLDRRDPESGLQLEGYPELSYPQKRSLLDDLAYWMIKNQRSEVGKDDVQERLAKKLKTIQALPAFCTAERTTRFFLERSGMLNEPVEGKVDFAHRTFQEFMAAQAAVDEGDFGLLEKNAANPQWREVTVLASGLARTRERQDLIRSLLEKGDADQKQRYRLHLLAAACLETAVEFDDPSIRKEVEKRVAELVPPRKKSDAQLLADAAGEIAVPFLRRKGGLTAPQAAASIRALALIGSPEAMQAIAEYADHSKYTVRREVIRTADRFEATVYGPLVLSGMEVSRLDGDLVRDAAVRSVLQYMKGFRSVRSLDLWDAPISDLSPLAGLSSLQSLTLWSAPISDLSPLASLGSLQSLTLGGAQISDLSPLAGLSSLQSLDLRRAQISDLSPLAALKGLKVSLNAQSLRTLGSQMNELRAKGLKL